MYLTLIIILAVLFASMLGLNIYFRVKVLKAYKALVQNRVDFSPRQIMSKRRVEEEIIPDYPNHADLIRQFSDNLHKSIRMGTVLLLLITLFGGVLMWYR
ncbi:MAG: hypothetical protein AAGF87_02740 [Bacteroidota bacterium]